MKDQLILKLLKQFDKHKLEEADVINKIWDYNHTLYYQLIETFNETDMARACSNRFGGSVSTWRGWINWKMWSLIDSVDEVRDEKLVQINQTLRHLKLGVYYE